MKRTETQPTQSKPRDIARSRLEKYRAAANSNSYEKGSLVKPVKISKNDPSVRRILNLQK